MNFGHDLIACESGNFVGTGISGLVGRQRYVSVGSILPGLLAHFSSDCASVLRVQNSGFDIMEVLGFFNVLSE